MSCQLRLVGTCSATTQRLCRMATSDYTSLHKRRYTSLVLQKAHQLVALLEAVLLDELRRQNRRAGEL